MNQETAQPKIESITPVGFRVLLSIYKKSQETSSGFSLPDSDNAGMPVMAMITTLGKKTLLQEIQMILGLKPRYRIGQWVYFRKYSIDELIVNTSDGNLNLYVLEEAEIIGVVNQ